MKTLGFAGNLLIIKCHIFQTTVLICNSLQMSKIEPDTANTYFDNKTF